MAEGHPEVESTPSETRGPRSGVLDVDEDELVACVACGLCLPHCPTYRVTGMEIASPRGRIAAMREVEFDGAALEGTFRDAMEACVQCRGCEAACPSGVPFGRLMEGAREALAAAPIRSRGLVRSAAEWIGYVVVLPRHRLVLGLTWLAWLGQRVRLVPQGLGLPRLSRASLRRRLRPDPHPDVVLFTGCVMDAWQREVHRAAFVVMRAAGARPGVPGRGGDCCGALHMHAGRIDEARRLARRVIRSVPGTAPIVVDSAGCGAAMKEYARLLGTDEARGFSARVRDFAEWVAEQPPLPLSDTGRAVVIQDPCHLRHVQRAHLPVRGVLAPAYRVRETDDDGVCCGAGGAYAVVQPELANAIRARKVAAIHAAGGPSPVVVSGNPGCSMHLAAAGLDVRHPAELLAAALEFPGEHR